MAKRRVVVTGMGMVTPLGLTVDQTWRAILAGENGVSLVERIDTTNYFSKIAATVKGFDPTEHMSPKEARKVDGFIQYAVAAAAEAVKDSGLDYQNENGEPYWCCHWLWYWWISTD